jgi:hypothetical protein
VIEPLREWRNEISHGKHFRVDVDDYHELHSKALGLLEELHLQISNAAAAGAYLASVPTG